MPTEEVVADIHQGGKNVLSRVLTEEEREIARRHREQRDFGSSSQPQNRSTSKNNSSSTKKRRLSISLLIILAIIITGIVTGLVWYFHQRELVRSTAERELKGYALLLNHNLPAQNQLDVNSVTVRYSGNNQLVVSFSQGNAHCTAPVNPPDDQHNLYWVAKVDAVPIDQIDTTEYKCVASVPLAGLGNYTP